VALPIFPGTIQFPRAHVGEGLAPPLWARVAESRYAAGVYRIAAGFIVIFSVFGSGALPENAFFTKTNRFFEKFR